MVAHTSQFLSSFLKLTNCHCAQGSWLPARILVRFNFQQFLAGAVQAARMCGYDVGRLRLGTLHMITGPKPVRNPLQYLKHCKHHYCYLKYVFVSEGYHHMLCLLYMYSISRRVFLVQYIYICMYMYIYIILPIPSPPVSSSICSSSRASETFQDLTMQNAIGPRGWRQCPLQSVAFPKNKALRSSPPLTRLASCQKRCGFLSFFAGIFQINTRIYIVCICNIYFWYVYDLYKMIIDTTHELYHIVCRWSFSRPLQHVGSSADSFQLTAWGVRYIFELGSSHARKVDSTPRFWLFQR